MLRKVFLFILPFVLASLVVWAQENDEPILDEDANACAEGGSIEGRCNADHNGDGVVSDDEVSWAWACGWYIIRFEAEILSEVPDDCESLIPTETQRGLQAQEGHQEEDGDRESEHSGPTATPSLCPLFSLGDASSVQGNAQGAMPEESSTIPLYPECSPND